MTQQSDFSCPLVWAVSLVKNPWDGSHYERKNAKSVLTLQLTKTGDSPAAQWILFEASQIMCNKSVLRVLHWRLHAYHALCAKYFCMCVLLCSGVVEVKVEKVLYVHHGWNHELLVHWCTMYFELTPGTLKNLDRKLCVFLALWSLGTMGFTNRGLSGP